MATSAFSQDQLIGTSPIPGCIIRDALTVFGLPTNRRLSFQAIHAGNPGSASGDTLYFSSDKNGTSDNWMVVRASEGWGTPQVLPDPINTSSYDGMYTRTKDGTIYIESDRPGGYGKIDVWRISPQNEIQNLGVPVNTSDADNDPFVSPDGKYLIFGSNYNDLL
jgi:Tol biopolymer transport system component